MGIERGRDGEGRTAGDEDDFVREVGDVGCRKFDHDGGRIDGKGFGLDVTWDSDEDNMAGLEEPGDGGSDGVLLNACW